MVKRYSLISGTEVEYPDPPEVEEPETEEEINERVAQADRRCAVAEIKAETAHRARVMAESDLITMTAKVDAMRDLLRSSEARVETERMAKESALARVVSLESEVDRMSMSIATTDSMRQLVDEVKGNFTSHMSNMKETVLSASARPGEAAPTFELSFSRDSNGRIKSPVTAKPRVQ